MRIALALAGFVALGAPLSAAPVPAGGPPLSAAARKQLEAEAMTYTQQLLSVATQVSAGYIRSVDRQELIVAGLQGLFEAIHQPLPSGIRPDLRKPMSEEKLIEYLIRVRITAGVSEALDGHGAILASCRGMLHSLDPFSDVVMESDRRVQPWGDQPVGIGLELADNVGVGPQRVLRVLPGSPAQRAGIRPGDEITHLDGQRLKGMTTAQAAGLLKGKASVLTRVSFNTDAIDALPPPPPEPVSLRLCREGEKPRTLKLEYQSDRPESIFGVLRHEDNHWEFLADRKKRLAHIRIGMLNRGTASDLADLLTHLQDDGLAGLVLDLRWSPGGFLDEAIGVAGLFLGDCVIASIKTREREDTKHFNTQTKRFRKLPLVVLVNEQTAGGSELIAAALQDHGRAVIAGQRTLGKASVQTALYIDVPGANVKLTSGEFVRPSGKNLPRRPGNSSREEWGIRPLAELEYRQSPELSKDLKKQWEQQTLRPGTDEKILPLDDPANDPQRQITLDWLRKRVK
jgi:carboxyl-terminal processing protease